MSLKDISNWRSLLDPSCQITTDVMFVVMEDLMINGRTVQVMNDNSYFQIWKVCSSRSFEAK